MPAVAQNDSWAKNPIDDFILARLKKAGMHPSPEASKEVMIRRVTLDLTGLLPTPAEVQAFLQDQSPDAYEHLVDRLLAKPTYGEERARHWLDYARYADTYGIHLDNSRDIWPYRDYVIRSFNSNKPFDQFTVEQIAGDLLPAKTIDPLIASGYVRLGASSNEGGAIPEELRANIARERAEAYGATFMGLTVGCAVCHDHKYDPTSQKDFYALTAFFNNIDEKPFNGDRPVWTPVARIPKAPNQEAYNRVVAERSELAGQLASLRSQERVLISRWLASRQNLPQSVSADKLDLRLRLDEGGGETLKNSAPHAQQASFPIGKFKPQWGETTWLWPDFRMDASTHIVLGQTGDYEANQAFSSGGWFMVRSAPNYTLDNATGTLLSKMDTNQHNRGWDLSIEKGIVSVELVNEAPKDLKVPKMVAVAKPIVKKEVFEYPTPVDLTKKDLAPNKPPEKKSPPKDKKEAAKTEKPKALTPKPAKDTTPWIGIKVSTTEPLPVDGHWRHVFFAYDGSGTASGVKIYVDGAPVRTIVVMNKLAQKTIRTQAPMQLGWRYPDADPARETRYQDIRLYGRALTPEETQRLPFEDYVAEVISKPADKWSRDERHAVSDFYFNYVDQAFHRPSETDPAA